MSTQQLRYFSMFSGVGGFELGIQRAFDFGESRHNGQVGDLRDKPNTQGNGQDEQHTSCIGYSEIDKYAIKVYERHFGHGTNGRPTGSQEQETQVVGNGSDTEGEPTRQLTDSNGGHTNYGDATKINAKELPDFDLLVGGFPCQAFSVAGKRKGFEDTRGTLFFDIARILSEKRPRHLVLENVKGLLSHDSGKTLQTILGVLSDLGYRIEWQVLNSKDFGVPQNRERIFIVGHLRGECSGKVFPITGTTGKDIKQLNPGVKEGTRIRRLTPLECERLQGFPDNWTEGESDTQRYKMCGNAVTVNVVEAVMRKLLDHAN